MSMVFIVQQIEEVMFESHYTNLIGAFSTLALAEKGAKAHLTQALEANRVNAYADAYYYVILASDLDEGKVLETDFRLEVDLVELQRKKCLVGSTESAHEDDFDLMDLDSNPCIKGGARAHWRYAD